MPQNLKPTNNLSNILLNRYTSPCLIVPRCNMGKFYEIWICWIFPHQSNRTQARINELTTNYKMVFDTIYHHCQKVMMAKKMKSLQLIVVGRNQIRAVKGIFTSAAQILKNFYCWVKLNDNVQLNPIQRTIFLQIWSAMHSMHTIQTQCQKKSTSL